MSPSLPTTSSKKLDDVWSENVPLNCRTVHRSFNRSACLRILYYSVTYFSTTVKAKPLFFARFLYYSIRYNWAEVKKKISFYCSGPRSDTTDRNCHYIIVSYSYNSKRIIQMAEKGVWGLQRAYLSAFSRPIYPVEKRTSQNGDIIRT